MYDILHRNRFFTKRVGFTVPLPFYDKTKIKNAYYTIIYYCNSELSKLWQRFGSNSADFESIRRILNTSVYLHNYYHSYIH